MVNEIIKKCLLESFTNEITCIDFLCASLIKR